MARDYDNQLLESVSVRRRRLRDALLHGVLRTRRTTDENLTRVFASLAIVAVLCAGCVGWAFISHRLAKQGSSSTPRPAPAVTATATPR